MSGPKDFVEIGHERAPAALCWPGWFFLFVATALLFLVYGCVQVRRRTAAMITVGRPPLPPLRFHVR